MATFLYELSFFLCSWKEIFQKIFVSKSFVHKSQIVQSQRCIYWIHEYDWLFSENEYKARVRKVCGRSIDKKRVREYNTTAIQFTNGIGLCVFVCLMVFNATLNNISVISWRSVLLVEETGESRENHRPFASH